MPLAARHDPITERGIDYPRSTMVEVWDGANRSVLSAVLAMGYPAVYAGSYCENAGTRPPLQTL